MMIVMMEVVAGIDDGYRKSVKGYFLCDVWTLGCRAIHNIDSFFI